jgi:hypothetical protein
MDKINNIIKGLTINKYIPKTERSELENVCKELDKTKHDKILEELKEMIKTSKYTKKQKRNWIN